MFGGSRGPLVSLALTMWAIVFLAIYLPGAGHGFVKDDFAWVREGHVRTAADITRVFHADNGFYRPVVALTFAADEALFGLHPLAYGWTNVALAILCGVSIAALARGVGLAWGAAVAAAAIWLLNPHGIHWAVLWISGRTALVLTLAATLAANAVVRGRFLWGVAFLTVALFAKEEALLLGPMLLVWILVLRGLARRRAVSPAGWALAALVVTAGYLFCRSSTAAMTPFTAPAFYRFTFSPLALARNIGEYADRAVTFPAAMAIVGGLLLGVPRDWRLDPRLRAITACGVAWLVGGYALTVFVPVRSELYACFPSVGSALVAAAWCASAWAQSTPRRRNVALVGAVAAPLLLSPVYYLRAQRWVTLADFSTRALLDLGRFTADAPAGVTVVIHDELSAKSNMASAFGSLLRDAVGMTLSKPVTVAVDPPVDDTPVPCGGCFAIRLRVTGGRLARVP